MGEPLIRVRGLCKSYGDAEVLRDIDLDINKGDVIAVIGPSGCGKSQLFCCLNFLEPPTSGEVWFEGKRVFDDQESLRALRRKMGVVFQSFDLFSNMTVVENAMLAPVRLLGMSRQEAYERAMRLLEAVGLTQKALSYPDELSGGQKQRAAIARTLAMEPEVLLFDEPTSSLDPNMVGEVNGVIKMLALNGATMLIATHQMQFARSIANRVLYMDEKGVYEEGTPEQIFDAPLRPKTRDFIFRARNFTFDLDPKDFDFYELLGNSSLFLRREMLDEQRILHVAHVLEESILHCVFVACPDRPCMLTICHVRKTDELELLFADPEGKARFPFCEMDEMGRRIIEGYSQSVECAPGTMRIRM